MKMNKRFIRWAMLHLIPIMLIVFWNTRLINNLQAKLVECENQVEASLGHYQLIIIEPEKKDMWDIAAETYDLDVNMLKAIAYHETGFLKSKLWLENNNPGGITLNSGKYRTYPSQKAGVMGMAALLKNSYIDQGLDTLVKIQKVWAPVGAKNDPNDLNKKWLPSVTSIYNSLSKGR